MVERLGEVEVEARTFRTTAVLVLAVAGDGDNHGILARLEHLGELRGGDADPSVLDADNDLAPFSAGRKQDMPLVLAVFRRIIQEIHHDLLEAGRVDVDPEISPVDQGLQRVLSFLDEGSDGGGSTVKNRGRVHHGSLQLNLSSGDAGDVHEVVDEP